MQVFPSEKLHRKPVSTVSYTNKSHLETGGNSDRKRSSRPKVSSTVHQQISVSSVKRRLWAAGLAGRVAVRKAFLKWQDKKKRLPLAMKRQQWTTEDWKKVLWATESKLEICGSSHRVFVHRWVCRRMVPQCVLPTVKLVERCDGLGLFCWIQLATSTEWLAPWTKRATTAFCSAMPYPLDRRVTAKQPTSETHLRKLLQQCWKERSDQCSISTVKRMPPVCSALISAKGYFESEM